MWQFLRDIGSGIANVVSLFAHELGFVIGAALIALFGVYFHHRIRHWKKGALKKRKNDILIRYLETLTVKCSALPFGDPTRKSMDAASIASIMTLDQVWTPLRATDYRPADSDAHPNAPGHRLLDGKDEVLVSQRVDQLGQKRVLVLGDPGHGKSTLISHYTIDQARLALELLRQPESNRNADCRVPVRVFLGDIVISNEPCFEDVWTGVPEVGIKANELKEQLLDKMRSGTAVVLMDGLDEITEENLPHVKHVIEYVFAACHGSQVILTCRTYDYSKDSPNRKVPIDAILRLLPYSLPEMQVYVANWYKAVVRAGRVTTEAAERLSSKLLSNLEHNKELRTLAETPLLLTLLTLVHTEEGELPASRALVYNRAVRYLLAETAQWRSKVGGATVATAEVVDLAQQVAYVAHCELERIGSKFRGLSLERLDEIVRKHFRLSEQVPGQAYEETSKKVSAHLLRLVQSHGLLLDQGGSRYAFAHRSFQEYLAGQYFAPGSHHAEALQVAKSGHWREAFRLLAGYGAREGQSLFYLLHLIDDLVATVRGHDMPQQSITDPVLAGEMLVEIGKDILLANGYKRVLEASTSTSGETGLWHRTSAAVVLILEQIPPQLRAPERVRAANVLDGLGDLRLQAESGELRNLMDRMIPLPAIEFTVGTPVRSGREDERPQRTFQFPPFHVSRFLITNLEFAQFINNDGYRVMKWWQTDDAAKWVTGDSDFIKNIRRLWVETLAEYHAKEMRDLEINPNDIEPEAAKRCAPRQEPFYWRNRRFNRSNQPVVGINWWEARAYCAWLTDRAHKQGWLPGDEILRLPTEFEWERAARGQNDGRNYPWGDDWDHDRAHTREDGLDLNEPTPVGCYPADTWPGGPLDLSGNVWEWLENLKLPYDKEYDLSRTSLESLDDRAIRGSSWYNTAAYATCSSRFVDRPYNLYFDVGFRVVRTNTKNGLAPHDVSSQLL